MRRHYVPNMRWIDLEEPALGALRKVLLSWEGTPYAAGQAVKGVGVDCVRFVCEVFKELEGLESIPLVSIPADVSLHSREGAMAAFHQIMAAYQPSRKVTSIQPGDVLVVGPANGGPGHAMIVGCSPNVLYHAAPSGVARTGIGFVEGHQKVYGIYRKDKSAWGRTR